ncbi:MAG TPA: hypothetical protein VMR70_12855 [Flavisolibacter sp.]|nr:hypothetical protein [Flavisolibacter sp.]
MRNRQLFAALLGIILLLPVLAIGVLQIGQAYIKATREERLETEDLVTVVLPAGKVVWEEAERELWVGDKMFDVSSYKIFDGFYHLTGAFDDHETEIAGSLLHVIFSGKTANLLQLLLLLQCFSFAFLLLHLALICFGNQRRVSFYSGQLFFLPKLVLGPPPRQ